MLGWQLSCENDEQKMLAWSLVISERHGPGEDQIGGRLPRDLRANAPHDHAYLLAGGNYGHEASEPSVPAESASTADARMGKGLRQPQQQRLSSGSPHLGQPRALPRRSPSGYAWQVEVASGKLVIAASKLMCKELGPGARCRLRRAAADQITALRYISEAVGVKSFERATTEMRADLDTPALAWALKATERKLQIAEQRVAALEASLSRQQNLRMHGELKKAIDILAGGVAANHCYKKVFMQYCRAEREATLREPYLYAGYHVQNWQQFG